MEGIVHPASLMGLAHVLQSGNPKMSPAVAVDNAHKIIRGLHKMGLEVGPLAAFGPHESSDKPLDALDMAADLIERDMGRKPWLIDGDERK